MAGKPRISDNTLLNINDTWVKEETREVINKSILNQINKKYTFQNKNQFKSKTSKFVKCSKGILKRKLKALNSYIRMKVELKFITFSSPL